MLRLRWRRRHISRGPFPVREWLAHRVRWLYYGLVLASVMDAVPATAHWWGTTPILLFGILVIVWGRHTEPLCVECLKRLPPHPRKAAKQPGHLRWLRLAHAINAYPLRRYLWSGVWWLLIVGATWNLPLEYKQGWWGVLYSATFWAPVWLGLHAALRHQLFQHFCPICRDPGRGNDEEIPEPTPDPIPTGTKELVSV